MRPWNQALRRFLPALVAAVLLATAAPGSNAQDTHLLVVVGLGGDAEYRDLFHEWATRLTQAGSAAGVEPERIHYLGERPDDHPGVVDGRSSVEEVERVFSRIATVAGPGDHVVWILIGHGSQRDGEARINLPGPDLTASQASGMLDLLGDRPVTVVVTGSASGGFLSALSGSNRVVITATRSAGETNATRFPGPFVEAMAGDGADTNKDGKVSMLEAFTYARLEVARSYEMDGILLTEHALLDDNGDGEGTGEPQAAGGDGPVAATRFMGSTGAGRAVTTDDPELARLYGERAALEAAIADLRSSKESMDPNAYEGRLEELLVEMALKNREIRAREGGGSP
jgi:hypothetical protein